MFQVDCHAAGSPKVEGHPMSKQLGILFKPEMIRAILEGRKTQTRRGVKVKEFDIHHDGLKRPTVVYQDGKNVQRWEYFRQGSTPLQQGVSGALEIPLPWNVGDYLYVKETWWSYGYFEETGETTKSGKAKRSWNSLSDVVCYDQREKGKPPYFDRGNTSGGDWRKMSSLFLAQKDARIWLKVTNVRVERLLDISEADAIAEGIISHKGVPGEYPSETMYKDYLGTSCVISPIHSYFTLWDSINGAGSHKENCWVWVIEFERCEKP